MPMPRHPMEPFVWSVLADNPKATLADVERTRRADLARTGMGGDQIEALVQQEIPSSTTFRRIKQRFEKLPPEERAAYGAVFLPGTCERGQLPWEAAPVLLELLRHHQAEQLPRPPVRLARELWHMTLADPQRDFRERLLLAQVLAIASFGLAADPERARQEVEAALLQGPGAVPSLLTIVTKGRSLVRAVVLLGALGLSIAPPIARVRGGVQPPYGDEESANEGGSSS